jgi:AcrR family transcriptional regulator
LRRPARPEEILSAACRVIVERGFHNTRVADIAEAAGTSTGTVHYYFASKQDVLSAALLWASERLFRRLEATAEAEPAVRLAALLDISIPGEPGDERGDEYVLWIEMWTVVLHAPDGLGVLERLSERWRSLFFDVVRAGERSGRFTPVAGADDVAERLIALVDGLGFETVVGYRWGTPERMRQLLVSFAAEQLGLDPGELLDLMTNP